MTSFFTRIRVALVAILVVAIVAGLVLVPGSTKLPIHWNVAGEPDWFAPREIALLMPAVLVLLLWAVFGLVARFARPEELVAGRHIADAAVSLVVGMAVLIEIALVLIGAGYPVAIIQLISLSFAVLLVVLGNALPKSQPNGFAGIRIPTTLRDPANWRATHRLGGVLSILGGVVLFAAAFIVPTGQLFVWLLPCIFVPMLAATAYSLAYAHRHRRPTRY